MNRREAEHIIANKLQNILEEEQIEEILNAMRLCNFCDAVMYCPVCDCSK